MNCKKTCSSKKFRLGTTLVVPFVLQIFTTVGLVWFITYRSGQQAVTGAASQLRSELTNRIIMKLDSYTNIPEPINHLNAGALEKGELNITNPQGQHPFWQQMEIYPTISNIYCGDKNGSFLGVGRLNDRDRSELSLLYSNASTNFQRQDFVLDKQGNAIEQTGTTTEPHDPRSRPWYRAAKAAGKSVWSEIYLSFSTQHPTITASVPVYNRNNGSLIGVCATDFFLPEEVNDFLRKLRIGKTGTAFIMERSGKLVATASSQSMVKTDLTSERLLATKSNDPIVNAIADGLGDRLDNFSQVKSVRQLDLEINGQKQYVQVVPFQDDNLDWLVVLTIPEADFMSQIYASRRNSLLFSAAAIAMASGIGVFTSNWVAKPILRVSHASDELAKGDLDQQVAPSPIVEINALANSFNSMAGQLKDSFTNLEQNNERLRIAEENYRSIFENAVEGIFQSSPKGFYLKVNPALAKIYGYESPQEMITSIINIGKQIYVDPPKRAEFRQLLTKQDEVKNFEYRSYRKDKSLIWIQVDARLVRDDKGKVLYYEGIVQDISERKRREAELKRQLQELKVEIDQTKREQEVARLTKNSYFQEVQQEIAQMDLDEFWS